MHIHNEKKVPKDLLRPLNSNRTINRPAQIRARLYMWTELILDAGFSPAKE
ncbi:MAG: hypothetical protein ACEROO_07280 [Candidatus Bathyarchaeota archaeon]